MRRVLFAGLAFVAVGIASSSRAQTPPTKVGVIAIRYVTVLVTNADEALAWYTRVLGFKKVEDRSFGPGRRWLVVAPDGQNQPGVVLEVAAKDSPYANRIGKETNWVLQVADCSRFYESLSHQGVHFLESPKTQPWGTTQAIFEDPYGNIFVAESRVATIKAD
ncbi:MAG: VOC family protein [Burkholderiaceae bacterium]|jgi:uncharacterized glyoxalase superfamily protein PhnB